MLHVTPRVQAEPDTAAEEDLLPVFLLKKSLMFSKSRTIFSLYLFPANSEKDFFHGDFLC